MTEDRSEMVAAKDSSVAFHRIKESSGPCGDHIPCGRLMLEKCKVMAWETAQAKGLKPCGHCYDRAYDLKYKEAANGA